MGGARDRPDDPTTAEEPTPLPPARAAVDLELTQQHRTPGFAGPATVSRIRVSVVEGPGAGAAHEAARERLSIGSHELNDLVIEDPTVSRFHCELRVEAEGPVIVDLRSRNGTIVDGVRVREALLRSGSLIGLGAATVRFEVVAHVGAEPEAALPATRFGALVGVSRAMRQTIALLGKAAGSDVTVLLEGETGTGKGRAAEAVHAASGRAAGPFVVVDCGAIPANLLESELFGHEKGAFTGADRQRIGAFEEASGGTLFLDEIGELPQELQPKLLRVLENRELRRVGANRFLPVDLRVIAATNRDLRAEVNAGRFRSDLYYRLAVVKIPIPPLRDRPEDIPAIVDGLLEQMKAPKAAAARLRTPGFLSAIMRGSWPGNVRELRNHVERSLVFADEGVLPLDSDVAARDVDASVGELLPYSEARRIAQDAFERQYLSALLKKSGGKVAQAAQIAGMDRVYLYRLLRRQGLKPRES
jgi:transcriptional regulator with GAF, ATPase, and Fis domain